MRTSISHLFILFLLLLLLFPFITLGQTHTWTGNGGNNNWFDASNWTANTVPDATSNVLIPSGFDVDITTSGASLNFMTIEANANLEVNNSLAITTGIEIMADGYFLYTLGTLSGDATINNQGTFEITGIPQKIINQLTINNENLMLITETGIINVRENMFLNNLAGATIVANGNGGAFSTNATGATFNNFGDFQKVDIGQFGAFYLLLTTNNHGTIYVGQDQNILILSPLNSINNFETGILTGEGAFDITSPFTNIGKIIPQGNQAVELTFVNTFPLSPQSHIEIDVFGQDLDDYDKIVVFGNPFIEGTIEITLHFEASIDNEFTIITTTQGISGCDLPPSIFTAHQGFLYELEVTCTFDDVILKVVDKVLFADEFEPMNLSAFPNPTDGSFEIQFSTIVPEVELTISNILGQTISKHTAQNTYRYQTTIDGAAGIYYITARTADKIGTIKVVKK